MKKNREKEKEGSLQSITCTGTDNLTRTSKTQNTKNTTK